jgi:hypothetical protein
MEKNASLYQELIRATIMFTPDFEQVSPRFCAHSVCTAAHDGLAVTPALPALF